MTQLQLQIKRWRDARATEKRIKAEYERVMRERENLETAICAAVCSRLKEEGRVSSSIEFTVDGKMYSAMPPSGREARGFLSEIAPPPDLTRSEFDVDIESAGGTAGKK